MKNLNLLQYTFGIISIAVGISLFNYIQSSEFIVALLGAVLSIGIFNMSAIFFYKTLKSDNEYIKFGFSFINILLLSSFMLMMVF